ncbi:MAG: class I SAM-dependent methyltransferase [Synergistaceae bacterium]|jgi:SAM-dependent methyltransferase|nr:class I SAM-dependent methyltransferase [Synergistaceae bacterium]
MIRELLAHPLARGMDIDSPGTTLVRNRIIQGKPFLKKLYFEWYRELLNSVPDMEGKILELGSGAGFLKDLSPEVITSEVLECEGVDRRIDACKHIPFEAGELKAILMTDVFHHLPDVEVFFDESSRVVAAGGVISMLEPWVTPWSSLIYSRLHHEPFDPKSPHWKFEPAGPLSGANGALPWIVFSRDRGIFERKFPNWRIEAIRLMMPIAYLLSGGVSMRSLFPGWGYSLVRSAERALGRFNREIAMFAFITLRRI